MSGNGKAENGRGNRRKRPFRRQNRDNNARQDDGASSRNGVSSDRKAPGMGRPAPLSGHSQGTGRKNHSENQGRYNRGASSRRGGENSRREKAPFFERPKWVPPKVNTEPLPVPDCPWCGKPIRDISLAITDRNNDAPVHFECVTAKIAEEEHLEKGDTVTYIGGGRFAVVSFGGVEPKVREAQDSRTAIRESSIRGHDFKIKKIIEWEDTEKRAEWRSKICDHFSVT